MRKVGFAVYSHEFAIVRALVADFASTSHFNVTFACEEAVGEAELSRFQRSGAERCAKLSVKKCAELSFDVGHCWNYFNSYKQDRTDSDIGTSQTQT